MEHLPLQHIPRKWLDLAHCPVCGRTKLRILSQEGVPEQMKCSTCGSAFEISQTNHAFFKLRELPKELSAFSERLIDEWLLVSDIRDFLRRPPPPPRVREHHPSPAIQSMNALLRNKPDLLSSRAAPPPVHREMPGDQEALPPEAIASGSFQPVQETSPTPDDLIPPEPPEPDDAAEVPIEDEISPEVLAEEVTPVELSAQEGISPEILVQQILSEELLEQEAIAPELPVETIVYEQPVQEAFSPEIRAQEWITPDLSAEEAASPELLTQEAISPELPVETIIFDQPVQEEISPEQPTQVDFPLPLPAEEEMPDLVSSVEMEPELTRYPLEPLAEETVIDTAPEGTPVILSADSELLPEVASEAAVKSNTSGMTNQEVLHRIRELIALDTPRKMIPQALVQAGADPEQVKAALTYLVQKTRQEEAKATRTLGIGLAIFAAILLVVVVVAAFFLLT